MEGASPVKQKLAVWLGVLTLAGCELEPEQLPPRAEVEIVVDTDLDPAIFIARLKVDLYDEQERWISSREYARDDPAGWPSSFVLVGDDPADANAATKRVLVRLRLYPSNKVRDYRGERFFPPGSVPADECRGLLPGGLEGFDFDRFDKRLYELDAAGQLVPELDEAGEPIVIDGEPQFITQTPLDEPLPELTVDRMLPVELVPGNLGRILVMLRGACLGVQASFGDSVEPADELTCVDAASLEGVGFAEVEPLASTPLPSVSGTFPGALPCLAEVDSDRLHSFKEEVCLDGGLFFLGDLAVFGFGPLDPTPEHAAVVAPFVMDRNEVTVGRFREALEAGLLGDAALPVVNDQPLAFGQDAERACTFTTEGRDKYPLNCVSWETARAFCQATGGDLPTEAQWEFAAAASGRAGRETRYPWGSEEPTCTRAVFARSPDLSVGATRCAADEPDVGVQPLKENVQSSGDKTPTGIVGMGGSLSEMVLDAPARYCAECWYEAPLGARRCGPIFEALQDLPPPQVAPRRGHVVRGGNWTSDDDTLLAGFRVSFAQIEATEVGASVGSPRVGFRCVRPGGPP